jgi:hypothetical protein
MLKRSERERLEDCLLLVESARNIQIGPSDQLMPGLADIDRCFRDVDCTLQRLLRA